MLNYIKLFKDRKIEYTTKSNRGWVNIRCPFCDDTSLHGGFNLNDGHYNCWKCGIANKDEALKLALKLNARDLRNIKAEYEYDGTAELNRRNSERVHRVILPCNSMTVQERSYLIDRGFDPRELKRVYGITGGGSGKWKNRIVIPVYEDGIIQTFVARSIHPKEVIDRYEIPRYLNLNAEESLKPAKECLFNLDHCRSYKCILVEGCFDVMRLGNDFLCSCGTQVTQKQMDILASRFRKITILFDNEREAQAKARRYAMQFLSMGVECEVSELYGKFGVNDGGELSAGDVSEFRRLIGI